VQKGFFTAKRKKQRQYEPCYQLSRKAEKRGKKQRRPRKQRPRKSAKHQPPYGKMPGSDGRRKAQQQKIHQKIIEKKGFKIHPAALRIGTI